MKSLIILGVPRAGKTLLARQLHEDLGHSLLPTDALVSTFGKVFPGLGITHFGADYAATCAVFREFLREYIRQYERAGLPFILDAYHAQPGDLAEFRKRCAMLCLGYPRAPIPRMLARIREQEAREDWTTPLSDAELGPLVERFVTESQSLERQCAEAGIPFLDTGTDFAGALALARDRLLQAAGESP